MAIVHLPSQHHKIAYSHVQPNPQYVVVHCLHNYSLL